MFSSSDPSIRPLSCRPLLTAVFALLLLLAPLAAGAQQAAPEASAAAGTDAAALEWLERSVTFYNDNIPYQADFTMDMQMDQQGVQIQGSATGDLAFVDEKTMRMAMDLTMKMPQLQQPMTMAMLVVADGEVVWMEMANSMLPQPMVMKATADEFGDLQQQAGMMGPGMGGGRLDPAHMLETYTQYVDLSAPIFGEDQVILAGSLRQDYLEENFSPQQREAMGEEFRRLTLVLDRETAAMESLTIGDPEAPALRFDYQNFRALGAEEVEALDFTYTPPEGVPVRDLAEMAAQGQGGGGR